MELGVGDRKTRMAFGLPDDDPLQLRALPGQWRLVAAAKPVLEAHWPRRRMTALRVGRVWRGSGWGEKRPLGWTPARDSGSAGLKDRDAGAGIDVTLEHEASAR